MDLEPRYEPARHEGPIYEAWKQSGAFAPRSPYPGSPGTFTVMIPPPNVTGVLHMGHALNNSIQDAVVRFRRMQGYETLWLPGTDHAGIATQAVVEKMLLAERGQKREELGRAAFEAEVWKWREVHGHKILNQLERLGCSCDWSRTRFTLDADLSRAVREAFVRLFEKGLIYRGARLVNWDCVLGTAVSDDEIEMVSQKDELYYIQYPVEGAPGRRVTVATTRPETMVADTGVAVHPEDERYRDLIGRRAVLPFVERPIPIVADESVDPAFGTGAVKITPGHDPADYERGERHGLPVISALAKDGSLNEHGGPFAGLPRAKARAAVLAGLKELGLFEKAEKIEHNVPISDRSKSVIEPLISEQWFVRMQPLAQPAIAAVESGALRFVPARWAKVYLDWLLNVRDWCISRQLWWGHRIPVWYDEDGVPVASRRDLEVGEPHPLTGKPIVRQDEDVLDTWASSNLWPFATLGWPDRSEDLARFYPTQFLSTAREIIYLWVARMVMAGYEFLDHLPAHQRCPFAVCNINATVLDEKGRRMSKSLGNGIDPIEMIDKYGADAVRFSLMLLTREGQDTKLAPDRFEMGWRFGNKVWNAARFVLAQLGGPKSGGTLAEAVLLEDRWILARLEATRAEVTLALEEYRLHDAASALYRFVWNELCDWYLEIVKPRLAGSGQGGDAGDSASAARGTLARVLGDTLALLHPFTPFQSEVLWKALGEALGEPRGLLIRGPWPDGAGLGRAADAEADMQVIQDLVGAVRSVRALTMIGEKKLLRAEIAAPRERDRRVLTDHGGTVRALAFLESCRVAERVERPPASACAVAGGIEAFVTLGTEVDLDKLKGVLEKRLAKLGDSLAAAERKFANPQFQERAAPETVAAERERLADLRLEGELLRRNLAGL